jgi:hypothetical protein
MDGTVGFGMKFTTVDKEITRCVQQSCSGCSSQKRGRDGYKVGKRDILGGFWMGLGLEILRRSSCCSFRTVCDVEVKDFT